MLSLVHFVVECVQLKRMLMVSIIVPVYNTGKVLDKCLKSILAQTYTDWECIVVNDCSTDKKTLSVLIRWKNKLGNVV